MNTASLELCKELYELSGWENTAYAYHRHAGELLRNANNKGDTPAYTLGYMLRKLPTRCYVGFDIGEGVVQASFFDGDEQQFFEADTPEDAACKLAIELIKQGVLKP